MSTRNKLSNPYGTPITDILYDSVKDEARRLNRQQRSGTLGSETKKQETKERFGESYRSEKAMSKKEYINDDEDDDEEELLSFQLTKPKKKTAPVATLPSSSDTPKKKEETTKSTEDSSPKKYTRDERSQSYRPREERSQSYRPREERTESYRPREERSQSYRPRDERSQSYRPRGDTGTPKKRYTKDDTKTSVKDRRSMKSEFPEEDESFITKSKAVSLDKEDIRKILRELSFVSDKPITIVEAVVDPLHETSLIFSKSSKVDKLYTFIGKNNSELISKFEKIPNIVAIEDSFSYTPSDVKSPFVLFFYPYWLMSMDKQSVKNVYFKNIPLHSGTFDDILKIEQPDLFAFVIPENVNVPEYYGKKKEIKLEKAKLVLITPPESKRQNLYGKSTGKRGLMTEDEYDKGLLKFLKDILGPVAKEETITKIVNSQTLSIWKKAFTHETIDLNDNYEQLETIGDRVLELTFLKYLLTKFPELTPQEITELKSKYMSKVYQGTMSRKLGFGDWIRVGNDVSSLSILEDVFESFFGALFEIGDRVLGNGAGYVMSLKILALIFSDVQFDLSKSQGHPRSQIKEIFEMLKLDPEIQDITTTEKGTDVVISITKRAMDDLVKMEKMKPNSPLVIGVGFGPYKTNAVNLAYSNALEYLESIGITRAWAEQQKGFIDLLIPELEDYLDAAFKRMEKERLDRIYTRTSRTTVKAGNVVIQLVGEYFDEDKNKIQKKILESGRYPDTQMGKIDVVKRYAEGAFS